MQKDNQEGKNALNKTMALLRLEPIYKVFILRLLISYLFFTITRVLFYVYNSDFFSNTDFAGLLYILLGGLKFDTVAILYTNALFLILHIVPFRIRYKAGYQSFLKYLFIITNGIVIAANMIDVAYFPFTLKRTTFTVFNQFGNEANIGTLFLRFLWDYWHLAIGFIIFIWLLALLYKKAKLKTDYRENVWTYHIKATLLMVLFSGLFIAGVRGGFRHSTRPITLSNAGDFISSPEEVHIVLNTPFSIFKTIGRKTLSKISFFENSSELENIYTVINKPKVESGSFNKYNIVVFILESMGKENIGSLNQSLDDGTYKGYTPFLDSLCNESLVFPNAYANGRKSIDILPTLLSSIPSIKEPFVLTEYFNNNLPSFPNMLRQEGYHTSFFHGAANGSMGFSAYLKIINSEHYFGMTEYNQDANTQKDNSTNLWGIWDELFFNYFAKKINTFDKPFFSTIFSLSSHHPFDLPNEYKDSFAEGQHPIHKTITYTDYSLKRFFEYSSQQDWYENTIFVITADHCQSSPTHEEYKTSSGYFSVPIIIYSPNKELNLQMKSDKLIQQTDIMPTVLGLMNYNKPYSSFGKDVLDKDNEDHFLVNHINGVYQFFYKDYILLFDGNKTVGLYKHKTDRLQEKDLKDVNVEIRKEIEVKAMAFIQQYNNRMLENRLIY